MTQLRRGQLLFRSREQTLLRKAAIVLALVRTAVVIRDQRLGEDGGYNLTARTVYSSPQQRALRLAAAALSLAISRQIRRDRVTG